MPFACPLWACCSNAAAAACCWNKVCPRSGQTDMVGEKSLLLELTIKTTSVATIVPRGVQ